MYIAQVYILYICINLLTAPVLSVIDENGSLEQPDLESVQKNIPNPILNSPPEVPPPSSGDQLKFERPMDTVHYGQYWMLNAHPTVRIPVLHAPFPTFGLVWPLPKKWSATQRFFPVLVDRLQFRLTKVDNYILKAAIERYRQLIVSKTGISAYSYLWRHQEKHLAEAQKHMFNENIATDYGTAGTDPLTATRPSWRWKDINISPNIRKMGDIKQSSSDGIVNILIDIESPGLPWPSETMDESYSILTTKDAIYLHANETWGGLRALESLSQLLWCTTDRTKVYVNETYIVDGPRFAHRGVMLDTSRHFVSKKIMLRNLEAMAYNKMNVLHWHMIDDQSFPYQSKVFPELSREGAYSPHAVYSHDDIKEIIEFARLRGIRVIPEFDVPGHTRSLSKSRPDVMARCETSDDPYIHYGTLNPVGNRTMEFLHKLFTEIIEVFKDEYVHLGGDEVETDCWNLDQEMRPLIQKLNLHSPALMLEYFWRRMQNIITQIGISNQNLKRKMVLWEDVLEKVTAIDKNTLVHVWKSPPSKFLRENHKIIYSTCWYLDHLLSPFEWSSFYLCDPTTGNSGNVDLDYENQVVGGETCMWLEYQTDDTVLQKIWPVASAVAERLWSQSDVNSMELVGPRLEEQSCRMSLRGIPVQAIMGPNHCEVPAANSSFKPTTCSVAHDSYQPSTFNPFVTFTFGLLFGVIVSLLSTNQFKYSGLLNIGKLLQPRHVLTRPRFLIRLTIVAVIFMIFAFILLQRITLNE